MQSKFKKDDTIKFTNSVEDRYVIGTEGRVSDVFERNDSYFYNVLSAGITITDVPENDLEFFYSGVDRNVDEYLRNKEKDKEFKDSDVRIGGTRKEMMAFKGMVNLKDLSAMEKDEVIARKKVNKNNVYPKVNTNEQIDNGVSGGTLYLKLKCRDLCSANPPDSPQFRALYVGLIQWFVELTNDVVTLEDLYKSFETFKQGSLRKSILIANPELEEKLIEENEEYKRLLDEFNLVGSDSTEANKQSLLRKELMNKLESLGIYTFNMISLDFEELGEKHFPEIYKEYKYWEKLRQAINSYSSYKILPTEYRFLHGLILTEGTKKISLLTNKEIDGVEYTDEEYLKNFGARVKNELIIKLFGEKFYLIINQSKYDKKVNKYFTEAESYEGVSQEYYDSIYESKIKPLEQKISELKYWIKTLDDDSKTVKEKYQFAIENTNIKDSVFSGFGYGRNFSLETAFRKGQIDVVDRVIKYMITDSWDNRIKSYEKQIQDKSPRPQDYSYIKTDENNLGVGQGDGGKGDKAKKSDLEINTGVPLSFIKRNGGVAVYDEDLDTGDKLDNFYNTVLGIRRITYGITLPDNERKAHAKHFASSIIDLAETLNFDTKQLIELGRNESKGYNGLGIKFAASGRKGAAAHYESDYISINLTRKNGDGTVAHEMAHFIDNCLSRLFPKDGATLPRRGVFASYIAGNAKNVSNSNIQAAIDNLMNFITKGLPVTLDGKFDEDYLPSKKPEIFTKIEPLIPEFLESVLSSTVTVNIKKNDKGKKLVKQLSSVEEYINYLKDRYAEYFNYNYYLQNKKDINNILSSLLNNLNISEYDFVFENKPYAPKWKYVNSYSSTLFYNKNKAMSSDYWTYYWELFARGFETYVYDKMAKYGRSNNYLVSGAYFDRPEGVYPFGIERDILYILYDELISVIKTELDIKDFTPFREQRIDEYIILNEDDTENRKVVLSENDDSLLESSQNNVDIVASGVEKLKKLIILLSEKNNKFEIGGALNSFELPDKIFNFALLDI